MRNWLGIALLATCLGGVGARPACAAPTVLNFEDLASGTLVNNQYGARGAVFRNAFLITRTGAHSPTRVLMAGNPSGEFHPGAMRIDFTAGQAVVKLFAGVWFPGSRPNGTLRAFDVNGVLLATDGPRVVADTHTTLFQISRPTAVIRRIELLYDDGSFESIDDLEFDGQAPAPVPTAPPTVTITSPTSGQALSANTVLVQGTVVGPQVTSATLRVQFERPLGSTANNVYNYPLTLSGTGDTRTFSQTVTLGIGPNRLTVSAQNTAALTGTAQAVPEYLPSAIRTRFAAAGGSATFGSFAFGRDGGSACTYAVYANGAVTLSGGTTRVSNGPIFQKWLALPDSVNYPRLGCASGESRSVLDALAQDFQRGRIYSTSGGPGVFVPPVFASAIDALGGELAMGLPLADPSREIHPSFNVWNLQRLRRSWSPLDTTIEIRGDPAQLWVYRQGGDGSLYGGTGSALFFRTPTIVESFPCSTSEGPCSVGPPAPEPPLAKPGAYCGNQTFSWYTLAGLPSSVNPREWPWSPPEWAPVFGHYTQTVLRGVASTVKLASGDNPFAHEHTFTPCPLGNPADLGAYLTDELICPSDWDLFVKPLPGSRWMLAPDLDNVAVEYERVHAQHFHVGYDEPLVGELIYASGRMIVDCGHLPFKTEIHPPSVLAKVRTVDLDGRPATQADIWATGFYSGEPVEFEIMPPPRPSPTATLNLVHPLGGALDMTVDFDLPGLAGNVRVRIGASPREVHVTTMGEMQWQSGRGYEGRLQVYWSE
jgi:hypothetical protein